MRSPTLGRLLLVAACVAGGTRPSAQATSSLSGRTVSDDGISPVGRAIVTVSGAALAHNRSVIADDTGQFTFPDLPAGRYAVTASKVNYLTANYGAKRPGRPGTPITVADGQRTSGLTLCLGRLAVITGSIRDQTGESVARAVVSAIRVDSGDASPRPALASSDDRGAYRLAGLVPGKYLVSAGLTPSAGSSSTTSAIGVRSVEDVDLILRQLANGQRQNLGASSGSSSAGMASRPTYGYVPVFYPGTPLEEEATPLTLALGEERRGIDLTTMLLRTSRIDGIVVSSDGQPMPAAQVRLRRRGADPFIMGITAFALNATVSTSEDGRFSLSRIYPGQYTVTVRASRFHPVTDARTGDWQTSFAVAELRANGDDIPDLVIRLEPGIELGGRVAIDAAALASPPDLAKIRLTLTPLASEAQLPLSTATGGDAPRAAVNADGTFAFDEVPPGSYRISATAPGANGWWLRSAIINGADVLDVPLELGKSGDVSGAVLTLSNRHTELSGTLQSPKGAPAPEYFVIAFPADRALWRAGSRRVQVTRPATDGAFSIQNLPGGDYLVAALTDVEPNEWSEPAFLQALAAGAVKVTLQDGERKAIRIQIAGG
jgi:hypothetical protein